MPLKKRNIFLVFLNISLFQIDQELSDVFQHGTSFFLRHENSSAIFSPVAIIGEITFCKATSHYSTSHSFSLKGEGPRTKNPIVFPGLSIGVPTYFVGYGVCLPVVGEEHRHSLCFSFTHEYASTYTQTTRYTPCGRPRCPPATHRPHGGLLKHAFVCQVGAKRHASIADNMHNTPPSCPPPPSAQCGPQTAFATWMAGSPARRKPEAEMLAASVMKAV